MTGRQEYDRTKDRKRILDKYMIDFTEASCEEGEGKYGWGCPDGVDKVTILPAGEAGQGWPAHLTFHLWGGGGEVIHLSFLFVRKLNVYVVMWEYTTQQQNKPNAFYYSAANLLFLALLFCTAIFYASRINSSQNILYYIWFNLLLALPMWFGAERNSIDSSSFGLSAK